MSRHPFFKPMPKANRISILCALLSEKPGSPTVTNPYAEQNRLGNLEQYFRALISHPYSGDLLVGEAPGHCGCARTGIPFTSESVILDGHHPFLAQLRPRLICHGRQSESTAECVWACLHASPTLTLPAFWNAFPLHPHAPGDPSTNRKPNASELAYGATVLAVVLHLLAPSRVFAVGRVAEQLLSRNFPGLKSPYLRHPARGGHAEFAAGLKSHGIL
jgi:uracil-DNA glycosylase